MIKPKKLAESDEFIYEKLHWEYNPDYIVHRWTSKVSNEHGFIMFPKYVDGQLVTRFFRGQTEMSVASDEFMSVVLAEIMSEPY